MKACVCNGMNSNCRFCSGTGSAPVRSFGASNVPPCDSKRQENSWRRTLERLRLETECHRLLSENTELKRAQLLRHSPLKPVNQPTAKLPPKASARNQAYDKAGARPVKCQFCLQKVKKRDLAVHVTQIHGTSEAAMKREQERRKKLLAADRGRERGLKLEGKSLLRPVQGGLPSQGKRH